MNIPGPDHIESSNDPENLPSDGLEADLSHELRASVQWHGEREALRYKWIEHEKAGRESGEAEFRARAREHWNGFLRHRWLGHLQGKTFWLELDRGDFGLLQRSFESSPLIDPIVEHLTHGRENLDIIVWALHNQLPMADVLRILESISVNGRRIQDQFAGCDGNTVLDSPGGGLEPARPPILPRAVPPAGAHRASGGSQDHIEQPTLSAAVPPAAVLERFDGFVEKVEDDTAYVTLRNARGERLHGPYPMNELQAAGVGERSRFMLTTLDLGLDVRIEITSVPAVVLGPELERDLQEETERLFEGFDPADDY